MSREKTVDLTTPAETKFSIPQIRAAVRGRVIAPGDADFDDARRVFYGKFDSRPAVIIQPADVRDVVYAVNLARETGMEFAVRSGGHSVAGHSTTEGGILLDLSSMKRLEIDSNTRTAWADAGLTAGEYTTAAAAHGLVTGFGDTGSVGIGGLTLGGGVGYLVRKYGLTIDDLLAAEIVTADGQIRHMDADTHPDLFWAIRGGGGNFGVVTRFQFRLHEVDQIIGGMLILPATAEVIRGLAEAAEAAPDELSVIFNIMAAPPMPEIPAEKVGSLIIMALMVYVGDLQQGERAIASLRAVATPISDQVGSMRYIDMYKFTEGAEVAEESARSLFIDTMDDRAAQAIVEHLQAATTMAVGQFRVLGGAMSRVPVEATAFAHRNRKIMLAVGAVYENPEDRPIHDAWVIQFAEALRQGEPGVYVNFVTHEGEARVHDAYPGATWDRLLEIKRRYDPTNLFRLNQNIASINP